MADTRTVAQYVKALEPERRKLVKALRATLRKHLDPKVKERPVQGAIDYVVPLAVYPEGYHCSPGSPLPFAQIASRKNNVSLYLFSLYGDEAAMRHLEDAWRAAGCRYDAGKACLRIRKLEEVPLDVLGEAIARIRVDDFIARYEAARPAPRRKTATRGSTRSRARR